MDLSSFIPLILSFGAVIILKCVILHNSIKFLKWFRGGEKVEATKKCHNIYEYDFMEEYESESESDPPENPMKSDNKSKKNVGNADQSDDDLNAHKGDDKFQEVTQKLLATIRQRRQKTASALFNASSFNQSKGSGKRNINLPKKSNNFLKDSQYYAYLQEVLKGEDKPNKKNKKNQ